MAWAVCAPRNSLFSYERREKWRTRMAIRTECNRCGSSTRAGARCCLLQGLSSLPPPPSSFPSVEDQLRAGQSLVLPRTGPREEGGGAHPFRLREKVPVEGSSECLPWGSPRVTDTSTDTQTDRRTEMERLRSCGRPRCVQGCLRRRGWSGLLRPHHGRLERQAQEPRQ